jgi:hypothetical protein
MTMRIRRGPLFWGLFLIPLGAIPLLVRAGVIEGDVFAQAWRFWPLILVALGLALLLGRSQAGVLGTSIVALVLGIAVGGALATGTPWIADVTHCDAVGSADQRLDQTGSFDAPGRVVLDFDCGTFELSTIPTGPWTVAARYSRTAPTLDANTARLELRAPSDDTGRQEWEVAVPANQLRDVELTANAASGSIDLAGATVPRLSADANATDVLIDAGSAVVDRIHVGLNAGRARVTLGAAATIGDMTLNAGALELCVPAGVDLRIEVNDQLTFAHNLGDRGLTQDGTTWTRSGTGGPTIELSVNGNAASFTLDPQGGCK